MKVKARIKTSPCPFCSGEINITHGIIGAPFGFLNVKNAVRQFLLIMTNVITTPKRQRNILRGEQQNETKT